MVGRFRCCATSGCQQFEAESEERKEVVMAISCYKMRVGDSVLSVIPEHFREFFRWESNDSDGEVEVYKKLRWGAQNEILHTKWYVGDEPEMSYGLCATLIMPEEALEIIDQHFGRTNGLSNEDQLKLERQLQKRFTYGVGRPPLAPIDVADRWNYWRVLHIRALNVDDALQWIVRECFRKSSKCCARRA